MPATAEQKAAPIPVLVGLVELTEMFNVKKQTVYRWNADMGDRGGRALPEPDLVVSRSSMWRLETILVWAAKRGLEADMGAVARIKARQKRV